MTVQYDRSIPVLDNHCHICFPQPINQSLTDYEALFNRLAVSRAGLLSCPSSSHTENGVDPLENLKILYLKENLSVPCFAYAGFTWHQSDPQAYADFGQTMLDMGFDGFKTLEQHPRVRKMTGKGLSDPSFGKFFAFANRTGSVMVCHVGDPRTSWDVSTASPSAIRLGRVYADGFLPLDELYGEMEEVIDRCPDMKFILAHFYFMSDSYDRVSRLLEEHPNVWLDLTPGGEMYVNFTKDPALWRAFFLRWSHRLILGSDHYPAGHGEVRYSLARSFLEGTEPFDYFGSTITPAALPRSVLDNIYWNNVHSLLGAQPKPVSRALAYEHCLYIADRFRGRLTPLAAENLAVMTDYWKC